MSGPAGDTQAAALMAVLSLEERERDLYVGLTPRTPLQRIFGGQGVGGLGRDPVGKICAGRDLGRLPNRPVRLPAICRCILRVDHHGAPEGMARWDGFVATPAGPIRRRLWMTADADLRIRSDSPGIRQNGRADSDGEGEAPWQS